MIHDMKNMGPVQKLTVGLVLVGAINWGLVGLGGFMHANWNVVNLILGRWPQVEWIVYIAVGVSAVVACVNKKRM